jgi:AraC family transcriptional activator FtrA
MTIIVKIMPNQRSSAMVKPPHRIVLVAYDRLCTFEYSGAREVFGAGQGPSGEALYDLRTAAAEAGPLRADGGLAVVPDGGLELFEAAETIVVPGWRGPEHTVPPALAAALARAHRAGSRIVSICGGALVLAAAGLLSGRRATTHWRHCPVLAERHPDVRLEPDVLYVDEGDILTSAGSAAGLDLCLHIVRRDHGPDVANEVARHLVTPPQRHGSQAQFVQRPVPADETAGLAPLMDWMRTALGEDLSLDRLSRQANMSPRTFFRRFSEAAGSTPGAWILNERLERARTLLETTALGIDEIAFRAGLGSAAALRHHFRRRFRTTPTAHRTEFGLG